MADSTMKRVFTGTVDHTRRMEEAPEDDVGATVVSESAKDDETDMIYTCDSIDEEADEFYWASYRKTYRKLTGQSVWRRYQRCTPSVKLRQKVDKKVTGSKFREIFGAHASEHGWNLPKTHPRHILKFPNEIITNILSFMLVAPYEVTPLVTPCEWWKEIYEPNYETGVTGRTARIGDYGFVHSPGLDRKHKDGPKVYAGWYRKPIDATILRVCRLLHQEGLRLLYGGNEFVFDLNNRHCHDSHRFDDREHSMFSSADTLNNIMPKNLNAYSIQNDIHNMMNIRNAQDLPDWIFCDQFTRFLHSIGPKNATFIRKLRFVGDLSPKVPRWSYSLAVAQQGSIDHYLEAYMPFILRYCQNLQKLGIGIKCFDFPELQDIAWDPEDKLVQVGDDQIAIDLGEDGLEAMRASREERHHRKRAMILLDSENIMALELKPYLDETIPRLKRLQILEVKRWPVQEWDEHWTVYHNDVSDKPEVSWYASTERSGRATRVWEDMDIAKDAKIALAAAVTHSREMETAKQMEALDLQDTDDLVNQASARGRGYGRKKKRNRGRGESSEVSNATIPQDDVHGNGNTFTTGNGNMFSLLSDDMA